MFYEDGEQGEGPDAPLRTAKQLYEEARVNEGSSAESFPNATCISSLRYFSSKL